MITNLLFIDQIYYSIHYNKMEIELVETVKEFLELVYDKANQKDIHGEIPQRFTPFEE